MAYKTICWAIAGVAVVLLSGCTSTYRVTLEYYPSGPERAPISTPEIWLAQPADVRAITREIGQERSALGKREGSVKTKQQVVNWVGNALLLELQRAGYTVERCKRDLAKGWNAPSIVLAVPGVQKVYGDTVIPAKNALLTTPIGLFSKKSAREIVANIDVSLDVYYGNKRYRKEFHAVHAKNRGRDSNPAPIYKECYEAAMADIARQLVQDMDVLVGNGPD